MSAVSYVDHGTTTELRAKYETDPNVDTERIVQVDYVWGQARLCEAISADETFDYLVASHVIEHVPNIVGWLKEVSFILRPSGILSLAIPDKRYTFDHNRQLSTVGDAIDAHLRDLRQPSLKHTFDHFSDAVQMDRLLAWSSLVSSENLANLYPVGTALKECQTAFNTNRYIDVHCWIFTPESFFALVRALIHLDLFDYKVVRYFPTKFLDTEFIVSFEKLPPLADTAEKHRIQLDSLPRFRHPTRSPKSLLHGIAKYVIEARARFRSIYAPPETAGKLP